MKCVFFFQTNPYLSEGVPEVAVNDPVIKMFLLIQKFTDLVAAGPDHKVLFKCFV